MISKYTSLDSLHIILMTDTRNLQKKFKFLIQVHIKQI